MYQTNYQCYRIQGEDAKGFLQGQFSCDLEMVDKQPLPAAYCLPDGKVLAFFYLSKQAEGYLLTTNDDQPETFIRRLRLFVLRSKVTIQALDFQVYGLQADDKPADHCTIIQSITLGEKLKIVVAENTSTADPTTLQPVEHWNYLETLNGIPNLSDQLRGQFILPFINLDWLGAVSYQKGCYVGQEIIARLHYRSTPAKRSFVYTCEDDLSDLEESLAIITCVDDEEKPCRIRFVRRAHWHNKTALIVEMAVRNAPRKKLLLTHNQKNHILLCAPQPYSQP